MAQILSLEILNVFLGLKFLPSLNLNKIEHFSKVSYYARGIEESVSERLFEKGLCLLSGTAMTEGDLDRVVEVIRNMLE
jgi:dTDP-4-amino-4,6-dideoxygalactose transaminase